MLEIHYSEAAELFLRKLKNKADKKLIFDKIRKYAETQTGNVVPVKGTPYYRLRAGNYRIIFDRYGNIIEILEIGGRGYIYRGY